jgi:hypothetical protein
MMTLGTMLGECDSTTRSANAIGSSVSMEESIVIFVLIEVRAAMSAFKTGVERQFARASWLIVNITTRPSAEYDVRTSESFGERCRWICESRVDDIEVKNRQRSAPRISIEAGAVAPDNSKFSNEWILNFGELLKNNHKIRQDSMCYPRCSAERYVYILIM